jgi:AcrR family transcriptional regulator
MNANRSDRRIYKTKRAIEKGLIELMKTKRINDISIKELCEFIDINRGTFYNHYVDMLDLKSKIEDKLLDNLNNTLSKYSAEELNDQPLPLFEDILEFINKNSDIALILLNDEKSNPFLEKIIGIVKNKSLDSWGTFYKNCNSDDYSYFLEYAIHGCLGIINKWLITGMKQSPKNMAILLENIVMDGSFFLEKKSN